MALTNAEKQARWRAKRDAEIERLRNAASAAPSSNSTPELIAARKEIERLRSMIATQEKYYEERLAAQTVRKAKKAAADAAKAEGYVGDDAATLRAKLVQADEKLAAQKTRISKLEKRLEYLVHNRPPHMTKKLHRQVLAWLHPDRAHDDEEARKRLEKCFQEFSNIKFPFPPDDER
jgi:hypothetical protein